MAFAAIGGLIGAAAGAYSAGTVLAMATLQGAAVGMALGSMVDGAVAGTPDSGGPKIQELSYNYCDEGIPIAEAMGCTKAYGNIFWLGESYSTLS